MNTTICLNSKSGRGGQEGLQPSIQNRVYSVEGKSTAVTTAFITNIAEPVCVAMRGRMYRGEPQHYEARDDGKTNVLTRVEKDNYIAEGVADER